jgi:hypothetical protein
VIVELVFVRLIVCLHKPATRHLFNKDLSYCIRSLESLLGVAVLNLSDKNKSKGQNFAFFLDFWPDTDKYIKMNKLV